MRSWCLQSSLPCLVEQLKQGTVAYMEFQCMTSMSVWRFATMELLVGTHLSNIVTFVYHLFLPRSSSACVGLGIVLQEVGTFVVLVPPAHQLHDACQVGHHVLCPRHPNLTVCVGSFLLEREGSFLHRSCSRHGGAGQGDHRMP